MRWAVAMEEHDKANNLTPCVKLHMNKQEIRCGASERLAKEHDGEMLFCRYLSYHVLFHWRWSMNCIYILLFRAVGTQCASQCGLTFTYSYTADGHPSKAPVSSSTRVSIAQELNTWWGGTGDWTCKLLVVKQPDLPPAPLDMCIEKLCILHKHVTGQGTACVYQETHCTF